MTIWTIVNQETRTPFEIAFETKRAAMQYAETFGNPSWEVTQVLLHTEEDVDAIVYLEALEALEA